MADVPVVFGNVTAAAKAFLDARLGGPLAYAAVPNPKPTERKQPVGFVVLSASGGSDLSPVHERALLMVDSWGSTMAVAQDLGQLVRAHLGSIRNDEARGVLIYSAKPIGGLVFVPDPESDTPRYRQNFQLVTRGRPLS